MCHELSLNKYVFFQRKCINWRRESSIIFMIVGFAQRYFHFVIQLTVTDWKLFRHLKKNYFLLHSKILFIKEDNSAFNTVVIFSLKLALLWKQQKLASVSREPQEHPKYRQSQNTSVLAITEEYITQVFEEIEGRALKKAVPGSQQDSVLHFGFSV